MIPRTDRRRRTPKIPGLRVGATALLLLCIVGIALVVAAPPADAHGLGGLQPSNYRTRILSVTPSIPGVTITSIDLGARLQLTNRTRKDVTVIGYEGEPYLRIGPRGVYENLRSPSTYENRSGTGTAPVPSTADAHAPPQWHRIGSEPVARWHDHRAHWMGNGDPPSVSRAPDRTHTVIPRWTLRYTWGSERVTVTGDVRWIPGPSMWPWLAVAAVLAMATALLCLLPIWRWIAGVGLVLLIAAETAHVIGLWNASTAADLARFLAVVYSLGAILMAVAAVAWLVRKPEWDAAPLVLLAGIFVVIAGGLAGITTLSHSQLPTTLPPAVARWSVAASLGIGLGLVIGAARHLKPPDHGRRTRRPHSRETPGPIAATREVDPATEAPR